MSSHHCSQPLKCHSKSGANFSLARIGKEHGYQFLRPQINGITRTHGNHTCVCHDVFVSTKVLVMSCDFLNYSIFAVQNMFWHLTFLINFFPRGWTSFVVSHAFLQEDTGCSPLDAANDGVIIHSDAKSLHVVFYTCYQQWQEEEEEGEKGPGEEARPCDQGQHQMQQSFNADLTSCAALLLCVRWTAKFSPASGPETSENWESIWNSFWLLSYKFPIDILI